MALESSFPTTTPTTTATRWRSAACSPSPAPSSRSPTSATPRAGRWSRRRPRSCWPAAPSRSAPRTCPGTSSSTPAPASASTELAERENADVIVFGSEYRTAPGTVKPGISAHKLLLGGPAAIAVAPAGLRSNPSVSVNTVGVIDEGDAAARQTADSLAAALGAERRRARQRPGRPARRRLAARVAAGQGDPQRRERLRGRDRDLPGPGRPPRGRALDFGATQAGRP